MDFLEAVDAVIEITSRPDKEPVIKNAINATISFLTMKVDFFEDLVEQSLSVDPTLYGQSVSLTTLTRFKKFKYIKRTGARNYITPIGADKLLTPLNQIQPNRYYLGGQTLTFTVDTLTPTLEIGYYQYPALLTATNKNHFLLDKVPFAVIDLAAARIFQHMENQAAATQHTNSGLMLFQAAVGDFALGYVPGDS